MRIAILSNAPLNALGGAGQIAGAYAELLRTRGHEIKTWGPSSAFNDLGAMDALTRLWFHLNDLRPQDDVAREIRSWAPDVLLTHNLTGCGFGTPKAVGARWVHVLHDVQLIEPSGQIIEGESFRSVRNMWRSLWSALRHSAMQEPGAVASPTQWLLDLHKKYGWFKTCTAEVIPNPIMGGSSSALGGSPADAGRVIYVGRLDPDKGIDLLMEAWKKISDPSVHLTVVGEGSWREWPSDPAIDVRGPLPNADVRKLFAESAVAVMPSRVWENQPTVILEALAAGCAVVATDVGGVRETLGDAGWIVRPNSADALAAGIKAALNTPLSATRESARREILSRHDPEAVVGRLEGILKSNL